MELTVNFLINLVAGIVGILIVLWLERQRRPSLTMKIGSIHRLGTEDILGRAQSTWLRATIHNRNVPNWLAWVYRGEPALSCRAWITFHHLDGHRIFDREMNARWTGTDEPKVELFNTDKGTAARLVGVQETFDIPPGESTMLDIVFRASGEDECYGWNNESYLHNWRNPAWCLPRGRYIARIRVKTGGQEYSDAFMVVNDIPYEDFRLDVVNNELKKMLT